MKSIIGLRGRRMAFAAVATFAVAGGIAFAAIPDAGTGVYHACMKKNGTIRIIDPARDHCKPSHEVEITFNREGPKGDPGPQGPPGPAGACRPGRRGRQGRRAVLGHVHEPERPVLDQRHRHRDRAREPGLLDRGSRRRDQGREHGHRPDRGASRASFIVQSGSALELESGGTTRSRRGAGRRSRAPACRSKRQRRGGNVSRIGRAIAARPQRPAPSGCDLPGGCRRLLRRHRRDGEQVGRCRPAPASGSNRL